MKPRTCIECGNPVNQSDGSCDFCWERRAKNSVTPFIKQSKDFFEKVEKLSEIKNISIDDALTMMGNEGVEELLNQDSEKSILFKQLVNLERMILLLKPYTLKEGSKIHKDLINLREQVFINIKERKPKLLGNEND